LNEEKYKRKEVLKLYKERWNIEEGYKLIKSRLEVEDFSGTRSIVVKQDFYIKTLLLTINAILCQKINPSKSKSSGRVININKTLGLSTTKKLFLKIALDWTIEQTVDFYTNTMIGKFNYSRKGQKCSRNKMCHSKYNINYKTA
jgi:transposase